MPLTPKRIRTAGKAILCAGLLAGLVIYCVGRPVESPGILGVDIRTNRDRMQLERMGGKSYVLMKDFDEWFATLWHGRRLGATIAVLSGIAYVFSRALAHAEEGFASGDPAKKKGDAGPERR